MVPIRFAKLLKVGLHALQHLHHMKSGLLYCAVLLLCLAGGPPLFAAAKLDAGTHGPVYRQEYPTVQKRQKGGFLKRVWQSIFPKKQLRHKPSSGGLRWSFGAGALLLGVMAAVALFIHFFFVFALIAWLACIALGIIGLLKDERKAAAIVALSLALVLAIALFIAIYIAWRNL